MTLHTAYAAQYGSTVLADLTNLDLQTNPEVDNETSIGTPFPQFVAVVGARPGVQMTSRAVADVLGVTGSMGAAISGANPFNAFFARLGADGLPDPASVHRQYTATNGLLLPVRLSCAHRGNAQVDIRTLLYSGDGATYPLTISDIGSLPTLAQANVKHTLGKLEIGDSGANLTEVDCKTNLTVDFGQNAETIGCDSDVLDKNLQQASIQPVINITGLNALAFFDSADKIPPIGKPINHANTNIYLRKRSEGGIGFVADVTAEHIKLTAHGTAIVTQHRGQGTSRSEIDIQITCGWDGTNAPITIDTASAIT